MSGRVELVGELVRLAERFWGDRYMEAATLYEAAKVNTLIAHVNLDCVEPEVRKHDANLVAFVADGTGEERRRVVSVDLPFAVNEDVAPDGDAAEPTAEVRAVFEDGQAFVFRHVFALEFTQLAFELFHPCAGGGCVGFECRDLAAAKERAEPLKRLAAWVDGLENGEDVGSVQAAIVAYSAKRGA